MAQKQPYADMYFTPVQIAIAVGDDSLRYAGLCISELRISLFRVYEDSRGTFCGMGLQRGKLHMSRALHKHSKRILELFSIELQMD